MDRPTPHPIWAKTAELLGHPVQPSVSIVRGEPFYAIGPSLAAMLALVLGFGGRRGQIAPAGAVGDGLVGGGICGLRHGG